MEKVLKFSFFQSRKNPEKMIVQLLKILAIFFKFWVRGGTLVPIGVKVAVKRVYTLELSLMKTLVHLKFFWLILAHQTQPYCFLKSRHLIRAILV